MLFLLSSEIFVTPINFISLITSSFKLLIDLVTPFSPPDAKAYKYNLPPEHAVAPFDKDFKICVPLRIPPSQIMSIFPPTASTISSS